MNGPGQDIGGQIEAAIEAEVGEPRWDNIGYDVHTPEGLADKAETVLSAIETNEGCGHLWTLLKQTKRMVHAYAWFADNGEVDPSGISTTRRDPNIMGPVLGSWYRTRNALREEGCITPSTYREADEMDRSIALLQQGNFEDAVRNIDRVVEFLTQATGPGPRKTAPQDTGQVETVFESDSGKQRAEYSLGDFTAKVYDLNFRGRLADAANPWYVKITGPDPLSGYGPIWSNSYAGRGGAVEAAKSKLVTYKQRHDQRSSVRGKIGGQSYMSAAEPTGGMGDRRRRIRSSVERSVEGAAESQSAGGWWRSPTTWKNYGDANPEEHGGRFIRWEDDGWHMIETRKIGVGVPEEIGPPEATHVVFDYYFYPDDVFQGGKPENGLTDTMMRIVESLGDEMLTLNWYRSNPGEVPEGEDPEYAPDFKDRIAYYVVDLGHHIGDSRMDTTGDYWGYLDSYGISQNEFGG